MKRQNLQNIPVRSVLGRKIRQGFVNRSEVLDSVDFSELERVLSERTNRGDL